MADTYRAVIPYESLDPLTIGASGDDDKVTRETLELEIPKANLLAAIYPDEPEPVADATEAARAALESPVAGPRFSEVLSGKRRLAIVIDNQFRPTPSSKLLPPVFDAIGQRMFAVSEEPKAANLVKLSGNFLITSVIESLGEAMALVGKAGVDKHQYLDILTATLFGAPIYKTYGALIAAEQFEPAGFAASLGQKDIRLVLAAAEELQVPMPVAGLIRDRFLTLLARGGADLDWSAIGALAAWEAGAADPTGR